MQYQNENACSIDCLQLAYLSDDEARDRTITSETGETTINGKRKKKRKKSKKTEKKHENSKMIGTCKENPQNSESTVVLCSLFLADAVSGEILRRACTER